MGEGMKKQQFWTLSKCKMVSYISYWTVMYKSQLEIELFLFDYFPCPGRPRVHVFEYFEHSSGNIIFQGNTMIYWTIVINCIPLLLIVIPA